MPRHMEAPARPSPGMASESPLQLQAIVHPSPATDRETSVDNIGWKVRFPQLVLQPADVCGGITALSLRTDPAAHEPADRFESGWNRSTA